MNNLTSWIYHINDKIIENIARTSHEINIAYCKSLGDISQPTWENAPEWQKESSIKGVLFVINNPDASPGDQHNAWLAEKEKTGWKYGKMKDAEKKEHPCMVSYINLPQEQKSKDYIFRAVVKSVLKNIVSGGLKK